MKKQVYVLMLLVASVMIVSLGSCDWNITCEEANGDDAEVTFDLDEITEIALSISAGVYLKQGEQQSIVVKGKKDAIDRLSDEVVNGLWDIRFPKGECLRNHELVIYITVVDLNAVTVSGSGDIYAEDDTITLDHALDFNISGSGRINALLDVKELTTNISGSGDLNLAGAADSHVIDISGSGKVKAFEFITTDSNIKVSGSGKSEVYVDDGVLTVKISGSGKVYYKGVPSSTNVNISGSGSLVDAN